jgi:tripartite-type tricarboxylate transporter receptor subunit TctC
MMMNFCIPVSWYAIFAPAGTPRDVVAHESTQMRSVLRPE